MRINASPNNIAFQGNRFGNALGNVKKKILDFDYLNHSEKNISFPAYAVMLMGVIIGSRYLQARDKDEKREILTRDLTGLSTYLFVMPIIKRVISTIIEKKTGFITVFKKNVDKLNGQNAEQNGIWNKIKGYVSRDSGYQLLSFDDIINTYVKHNKIGDFCDHIIANTNETSTNLYKIFSWAIRKSKMKIDLDKELNNLPHNNKGIREWITNIENGNAQKDLLGQIKEAFREEGVIHHKALNLKAIPDLMALGITVSLLGLFLPWLNIKYTRKIYLDKECGKTPQES